MSNYANFSLGFYKLEIFRKWVGILSFCEIFSKSLIGLSPICCLCICVGPLWHFKVVLRHFSICSCILHNSYALLHVRCLTKSSDIYVINWFKWIPISGFTLVWTCYHLFWYLSMCFTHFALVAHARALEAHLMHLLLHPHASHAAHTCISTCSAQTHICTIT